MAALLWPEEFPKLHEAALGLAIEGLQLEGDEAADAGQAGYRLEFVLDGFWDLLCRLGLVRFDCDAAFGLILASL